MDVEAFLASLQQEPDYAGQVVHVHREPPGMPQWAALPNGLRSEVRQFLAGLGVEQLYAHQADAITAALDGKDVLLTTGTASGKSLCYQIPILQKILDSPETTTLFLFPTKALARDQIAAWNRGIEATREYATIGGIPAVAYDGDSSAAERRLAQEVARLLVTNPEMLHTNLLPNHARWSRFLQGLSFIILDEVHTYAGFFGANMANLLRRLQRVCEHYGARPQFICASATTGNPEQMAERITGRTFHHVSTDTSAAGSRTYVFWNPPRIHQRQWRSRRSSNVEAHELMVKLVQQRISTLCFSKARNTAEMIYRYVRESLQQQAPNLCDRIIPYRGGYSGEQRRDMERRLREGEILGVSATRALELGIDVGTLDACMVVGYPGTQNAFFQQMGRAGRGGRDALCILIGTDTPINQYIMQHPEFVFERPIEHAVVDQENPFVLLGHLRCAAAELPIAESEYERFGYATGFALEVLEEEHKVHHIRDRWYHAASEQPSHEVRLRGYGDESTVIMDADSDQVLDRVDKFRSLRIFYPGAIYFHQGDTYAMLEHDTDRNVVRVQRVDVPYYTDPVTGTSVDHVDAVLEQRPLGVGTASLGEVFAVLDTPLYEKVPFYSMDRISQHPIDQPSISYEAMAFWLETPAELPNEVGRLGLNPESGMKGILYCASRILPLFLTSDQNDFDWSLGCRNTSWHTMFWFEFYRHGIGHAEQCYERLEEIMPVVLEHLLTCDCEDGCPNCTSRLITPYHVRNIELGEGMVHSRKAAVIVLNSLLTGQSASQSSELLKVKRERRGQRYLPTITGEARQSQPHRIPLDERTRRLMLRKVERSRVAKEAVDHAIEQSAPVGLPVRESAESSTMTDVERRVGRKAIRHSGDPLVRRLQSRLDARLQQQAVKAATPTPPPPAEPKQDTEPGVEEENTAAITLGDSLARRAHKLKRGKQKPEETK